MRTNFSIGTKMNDKEKLNKINMLLLHIDLAPPR